MDNDDVRWRQRFSNYRKALRRFAEATVACRKPQDRLSQEGLIQRFEYTFELAWKTLQDLFQERGLAEVRGPKPVLQQALQDGLIHDGLVWMEMLRARNEAAHIYDEKIFLEIFGKATNEFLTPLENLEKHLAAL